MAYSRIIGIYLGAGNSTRMGENKLNLPFRDSYLGSMGFQAALQSNLDLTIAVTREGQRVNWLAPFSKQTGWNFVRSVRSEDAGEGQSASLKEGLKEARKREAKAVVVLLGDQPFVTSELINRLIVGFENSPNSSFVAVSHIPPILIAKSMFNDILSLEGDIGARSLLRGKWRETGLFLEQADTLYAIDIDTPKEYEAIQGRDRVGYHRQ